jgi:hypothetical protein
MPVPKPPPVNGYIALESLPVDIPWIPGATATFDLIRCVDLVGTAYDTLMGSYIAEEERVQANLRALPADAPVSARAELEAAYQANLTAGALALLTATRCRVAGINPSPDPDRPETWAHLHPALLQWLAYQGRAAAGAQLQSPLAALRPRR